MPISESQPCGPSLEYDHEYAVLLARMQPRVEAQYGRFIGAPEAPGWAEIERDCLRLLMRSKDINVLVWLCRARTRLGQAAGLAQALCWLHEVLLAWPEQVHPQVVIEGEREPAVRANALAGLADPEGLLADVSEIVIASGAPLRLAVRDVASALAVPRAPGALKAHAVTRQLAALRDTAHSPVHALAQAAVCLGGIVAWARSQLGDAAPSLEPLCRVLAWFAEPAAAAPIPAPAPVAVARAADRQPPARQGGPVGGARTRDHVLQDIRAAREWFEAQEPSSPVAVLLKQAERMVGQRFSQLADAIPLDLLKKWDAGEVPAALEGMEPRGS